VRFKADLQVAGIDGSDVSAFTNGVWRYFFEADAADSLLRIAYDLDGGTAQVFFDGEFLPQIFDEAPGVLELGIAPRSFEHNLSISYFSTAFQAGFPATLRNEATFTWNIVPEPSTILLLGGGLLVLAASQRRMQL